MQLSEFELLGHPVLREKYTYEGRRGHDDNILTPCGISKRWSTGGQSGGSCWDTGDEDTHYSIDGETEPEFTELDEILAKVCPTILFLQYKVLCSKLIHEDDYQNNEYYGNYTNYAIHWISMKELYEYLVENKLLCV